MTKQEVKESSAIRKESLRSKSKVWQIQFNMCSSGCCRMCRKADVVITNPTHYSVALKYDSKVNRAPIVIAKGADHMALKIREIAKAHKIELVNSPP